MSTKNTINKEKEHSLPPRRVHARRRSKTRASASPGRGPLHNGLMNAAWPKSPSRRPVSKETGLAGQQTWALREATSHLDQIEEMEIDSHDASVMLSCAAATEFNVMRTRSAGEVKKSTHGTGDQGTLFSGMKEQKAQGRRASDPVERTAGTSYVSRSARSAEKITTTSLQEEVKDLIIHQDNKKQQATSTPEKSTSPSLPPIFIVLHVNRIDVGKFSGPATSPVKIYAERIMIQMEDEVTSKDISLRIICRNIRDLEVSFETRPFFLTMKASGIQYAFKAKTASKDDRKSNLLESITLHLAYENEVPAVVQKDLEELFKERLSDFNLWKPATSATSSTLTTNPHGNQSSAEKRKSQEVVEIRKIGNEEHAKNDTRKRTPVKQGDDQTVPVTTAQDVKSARRILFQNKDDRDERIKSLEHEAAYHQLMVGHKRLEIQRLEQQVREKENELALAREEAFRVINTKDDEITALKIELDGHKMQIDVEKGRTNAHKRQITELRNTIEEQTKAMEEHEQAILVRDNQLRNLRVSATSPSKMTETELREQVRRLENSLQQTRANLDETRRSKNNIGDELRRNVDMQEHLREQLRSEISRNRRLEADATTAAQQLNDAEGATRAIQVELNDERSRVASVERELLISRRRIENEVNLRVEIDADCRQLRTELDEKDRMTDRIRNERDNAVTEIGILKREINHLAERLESTMINQEVTGDGASRSSIAAARDVDVETSSWVLRRDEVILTDTVLGVGGWGEVKLGKFRGTDVAVKQIHHLILSPHNCRLFNREMSIASRCRHPCLLQFIGATSDQGIPLFVSELLDTDLRSHLSQKPLIGKEAILIGLDIARALNYLHMQIPLPIIHRDISSSNVLLWYKGNELHGKLSDYGAANFMRLSMTKHPGALLYSAPETTSAEQTTKIDIFSFGVLFCEMTIRELPIIEQREQQIRLITKSEHRTLVLGCLAQDPDRRPSAEELVELFTRWSN